MGNNIGSSVLEFKFSGRPNGDVELDEEFEELLILFWVAFILFFSLYLYDLVGNRDKYCRISCWSNSTNVFSFDFNNDNEIKINAIWGSTLEKGIEKFGLESKIDECEVFRTSGDVDTFWKYANHYVNH